MAKKSNKQQTPTTGYQYLAFAVIAFVAMYTFGSWAVDTGSIWYYVFAFAALYFSIHYARLCVTEMFFKNGKKPAKRAK